jgi:hypothetical protein
LETSRKSLAAPVALVGDQNPRTGGVMGRLMPGTQLLPAPNPWPTLGLRNLPELDHLWPCKHWAGDWEGRSPLSPVAGSAHILGTSNTKLKARSQEGPVLLSRAAQSPRPQDITVNEARTSNWPKPPRLAKGSSQLTVLVSLIQLGFDAIISHSTCRENK